MYIKESVQKIVGRSIFDSRGIPTVEIDIVTVLGTVRASCPSGASTGSQEALELRDGDMAVCMGKGVNKALMSVEEIGTFLVKKEIRIIDQEKIDRFMIELDGTENKSRLGANAILPISICFARIGAKYMGMQEWAYLKMLIKDDKFSYPEQKASKIEPVHTEETIHLSNGGVIINNSNSNIAKTHTQVKGSKVEECSKKETNEKRSDTDSTTGEKQLESTDKETEKAKSPEKAEKHERRSKPTIPKLFFNVINGGAHADNGLFVQEIMVSFDGGTPYKVLTQASGFIHALKSIVKKKYNSTSVGDEGGFAPSVESLEDALDLILSASKESGISPAIALDVAASEFYRNGTYNIGWKTKNKLLKTSELIEYYMRIIDKYKISMIEDPFDEKDYAGWAQFMEKAEKKGVKVVGDDLIVTNPALISKAGKEKLCNVALIKMNQIGTITETIEAVKEARTQGMKVMASHRSGETEDTFLAHLSVGLSVDYLKAGSLCRTERVCKYNELIRIFERYRIDTI